MSRAVPSPGASVIEAPSEGSMADPLLVVSSDTHVGPRLHEDLRPYCEQKHLATFDEFTAHARAANEEAERAKAALSSDTTDERLDELAWNAQTAGHHDVYARLHDMDVDGVATEVVFHGSQNGQPLPFDDVSKTVANAALSGEDLELMAVGKRIYNRWLADFCSVEPERHVGLAQVPMWDVERATAEVRWASDHGLGGVNFPAPNEAIPAYEDDVWEQFFAACAERNMPLTTHLGHGVRLTPAYSGPASGAITFVEVPWVGRRAMWLLTLTGAFERHPGLKLVLTEVPGTWWHGALQDMDDAYLNRHAAAATRASLPRLPSQYASESIFLGASFLSQHEAHIAEAHGYVDRVMWGSDYPHIEGTWRYADDETRRPLTQVALANTFCRSATSEVRMMAGLNAARCYGLDVAALTTVAARVGPPIELVAAPPDLSEVPDAYHGFAFRTRAWS